MTRKEMLDPLRLLSALESWAMSDKDRILPEGLTPSRMYMSGTFRSWIHYLMSLLDPSTQKEHRLIAQQALAILRPVAPITMEAFFPTKNEVG